MIICWTDLPIMVFLIWMCKVMGILRWTVITQSKIPESYLEMPSEKQWETKRESNDLEAVYFRWMRHWFCVPLDLSGRPYFVLTAEFTTESRRHGYRDGKEFFYAVSYCAGMNLHIKVFSRGNNHHMAEACSRHLQSTG